MENQTYQKRDDTGVHQTHCCAIDGCKYGDKDCPVVSGEITQAYACEDCKEFYKPWIKTSVEVDAETLKNLSLGRQNHYVFNPLVLDFEVGQLVEFNNQGKNSHKIISLITNQGMPDGLSIASLEGGYSY